MYIKIFFSRFGVPRLVICDEGSKFFDKQFESLLEKYEVFNRDIKTIFEKIVSLSRKDWATKLDDAI